MVLEDDADAGGAYPRIDHSPWNGCTLADFVMPFFLFVVGVAIALALKRIPKVKYAVKNIILRTLKLLFWGILLQDRCLGDSYSILVLGMDRNECNASVCYGSTGHLRCICKRVVLQRPR
ncbi:hypothetical protein GLYMA_10G058701v4 [Glycine max]|nr:hypothetical protein GLYMA_10G058701v4 [Glycine max]KAH1136985.1 hypothetical protein GYH30_027104 [Glycine max]